MSEVIFGGKTWPSLRELCRVFGKKFSTIHGRLARGMSLKDALHETDPRSHKYTFNGKRVCTKELAKALGLAPSTIRKRATDGWQPHEVVLPRLYKRGVTAFGRTQSITAWAKERDMNRDCLRNRLRSGMQPEVALTLPVTKSNKGKKKEAA